MASLQSQILEIGDRLDSIQSRPLTAFESLPDTNLPDYRIPLAEGVEAVFQTQLIGETTTMVRWITPPSKDIDHFEFWAQHPGDATKAPPYFVAAARKSPCLVSVNAEQTSTAIISVITVMKSGLRSNINQSPTIAVGVEVTTVAGDRFEFVEPSAGDGSGTITITGTGSFSATIVDTAEPGRFIGFGVLTNAYTAAGASAADVFLDVTIDGGTTQNLQIAFNDRVFGRVMDVFAARDTTGSGAQLGGAVGDALWFPMNLTFDATLEITLRAVVNTSFGANSWGITAVAHRARLISA